MKKEEMVKVCPICSSENYTVDKSNKFLESIGSSRNYQCNTCSNIFSFPVELKKDNAIEISKEIGEKYPRVTSNEKVVPYGFFLVRFWFKIIGGIIILTGIGWVVAGGEKVLLGGIIAITIGIALTYYSFKRDRELKKSEKNG